MDSDVAKITLMNYAIFNNSNAFEFTQARKVFSCGDVSKEVSSGDASIRGSCQGAFGISIVSYVEA